MAVTFTRHVSSSSVSTIIISSRCTFVAGDKTSIKSFNICNIVMADLHETLDGKFNAFVRCHIGILVVFLEKLAQRFEVAPGCVGLSNARLQSAVRKLFSRASNQRHSHASRNTHLPRRV